MIGRPGCLHGHEPMRRIRSIHSSRLHSNAISKKTLNRFCLLQRHLLGDHSTHREAKQVYLRVPLGAEERDRVVGHLFDGVGG